MASHTTSHHFEKLSINLLLVVRVVLTKVKTSYTAKSRINNDADPRTTRFAAHSQLTPLNLHLVKHSEVILQLQHLFVNPPPSCPPSGSLLVLIVVVDRLRAREAQIVDKRKLLLPIRLRHKDLQAVQPLVLRPSERHLFVGVFVFVELEVKFSDGRLRAAFHVTEVEIWRVREELQERGRAEVVRVDVVGGLGLAVAAGVFMQTVLEQ